MLKVPFPIGITIVLAVGFGTFYAVDHAAAVSTATPAKVWKQDDCLRCHTDQRTVNLMKDKNGDPTYCAALQKTYKSMAKSKGETSWAKSSAGYDAKAKKY